jgi:hypothetical protein
MPNQLFPPLPDGWSISSVGPRVDHYNIDDRDEGRLFSGNRQQCSEYITKHTLQSDPQEQAQPQQAELLPGWKHVIHESYEFGALVIRGAGNHWSLVDSRLAPEPHLGTFATPQAAAREAGRLMQEDPELRQGEGQEQPQEQHALPEHAAEPLAPHQRYRELLEQISDLRYPDADASLRRKIEASIDKKVTEFMAEKGTLKTHAHTREQQQQVPPPPMRQQQQRGVGYER